MNLVARNRLIAAIVFSLIVGGLAVAVTLSMTLRSRAPEIAIAIWPWNAEAEGLLAGRTLVSGNVAEARKLAIQATRGVPGDARSLRALGMAEELSGSPARGAKIMNLAMQASRRDLQTNLWFVEYNVSRGNIDGAVRYYDFSLKSSAEAEALLFPILVPAMSDPQIAKAVLNRLKPRPVWTKSFLQYAFSSGAADKHLVPIVLTLSKDEIGISADLKRQYTQRLAERANFRELSSLAKGLGHPLVNGSASLDKVGSLPPADWRLLSGPGVSTFAEPRSGFSFVVSEENAPLAERFLHLPPGQYHLRMTADLGSASREAKLVWSMSCASNGHAIAETQDDDTVRWIVPGGRCEYQRLSLSLQSDRLADGGEISGLVSRIRLERMQ